MIAFYTLYIQYSTVVDKRLREGGTFHVFSYRGVLHLESNLVFQKQKVESNVKVPVKVIFTSFLLCLLLLNVSRFWY